MQKIIEKLDPIIREMIPELIETRRDLHRHPEIGYEEHYTSALIIKRLEELGYTIQSKIGETGVIATLKGSDNQNAPAIAFRADMDALQMDELSKHDYISTNPGFMHACGHDGHVAILLGFARWLAKQETPFPGDVKLLFQPAEEGGGGALPMIEAGALTKPKVDFICGLHLWSQMPVGKAGIRGGALMAATDGFDILITGKGGHGAMPDQTIDPIIASAHVILALQNIPSRLVSPLEPVVISICQIKGGTASNVIPDSVLLKGTARAFDADLRAKLPEMIKDIASKSASIIGAEIEFTWHESYPPTVNDMSASELVKNAAKVILGDDNVTPGKRTMGGEDMSYYLQQVPGCFFWLGSSNEKINFPQHSPYFDIDENALPIGVAIFAEVCKRFFDGGK